MTTNEVYEDNEIISDEVFKSPHRKRYNLSKRKKDNQDEGLKLWVSFWRLSI